jgi:ribosomal protein S18 acetylase RimI-like enzyme
MSSLLTPDVLHPPTLPGLTFRHFAGEADYAGMLAVRLGSAAHDQIDPRSSREALPSEADLRASFPEASTRDHPDLLLVAVGGQLIGYGHVLWRWTEISGVRVYLHLGYLLPPWRNRGIGSAMLRWAQARIRAIAASEQADARATFATNVSSTEVEAHALIREAGYRVVRRLSDMAATVAPDAPLPALPHEVELRPVGSAHHHAIYDAIKDANGALWTSTVASEEDYRAFLAEQVEVSAYDPALWQVAWVDGTAVGVVIGQIDHEQEVGHIAEVAVRPAWQRRRIARALLQRAMQAMGSRGVTHVRLYTDADDGQGARSLYESVGFRERKQHLLYRRPLASAAASGSASENP